MKSIYLSLIIALVAGTTSVANIDSSLKYLSSGNPRVLTAARDDLLSSYASASGSDSIANEAKVIDALGQDFPLPSRLYLLRLLEWFGTNTSVAAIAPLLNDPEPAVRDSARRALASIPGEEAVLALGAGLRSAGDNDRAGFIDALAYRGDKRAVALIAQQLQSEDTALIGSAARALGKMGAPEALPALLGARAKSGSAVIDIDTAMLQIGVDAGIASNLVKSASSPAVRANAFQQLIKLDAEEADKQLATILSQDDSAGRPQIIGAAMMQGGQTMRDSLAAHLGNCSSADKMLIATAIGEAGLREYESAVLGLLEDSGDALLRDSVIDTLGDIGGDDSFEPLYQAFLTNPKSTLTADAIARLQAPSADKKAMAAAAEGTGTAERMAAMKILELRNTPGATELLNNILSHPGEPELREAAMKALESIGNYESIEILLGVVVARGDMLLPAQRSLKRLCINFGAADELWNRYYKPALDDTADNEVREGLVSILDSIDCKQSLDYLKGLVLEKDSSLRHLALKTLARWNSSKVMDTWFEIAKASPEDKPAAIKGLERIVTSNQINDPIMTKLRALVDGLKNSTDTEFKLAVLNEVFDNPQDNIKWAIKMELPKLLDDQTIAEKVQEILDRC